MSKLIVTLQPLEGYFRGAENHLPYPQQTSVIKLIRYYVLLAWDKAFPEQNLLHGNGNIRNKELAKELIGEAGFSMSVTWRYGKIYSLSEMMLFDGKSVLLPAEIHNGSAMHTTPGLAFFNDKQLNYIPTLTDFNPKQPEKYGWISSSGQFFDVEELFMTEVKEGINENTFCNQVFFHMADRDLRFVFQMDVDDDIHKTLVGQEVMSLGDDGSKFIVTVSPSEYFPFTIPEKSEKINYYSPDRKFIKLVLISDAYFRGNPYHESVMGVTRLKPFCFIDSSVEMEEPESGQVKSKLLNLIERGSVFYFTDGNQLNRWSTSCGINSSDFRNIGYNQYVVIQPSKK